MCVRHQRVYALVFHISEKVQRRRDNVGINECDREKHALRLS